MTFLQDIGDSDCPPEFLAQIWNPKVRQWSPHKQAIYNNGVVIGKYLERDAITLSLCSEDITDEAIQTEIKHYLEQSISFVVLTNLIKKRLLLVLKMFFLLMRL